MVWRSRHDGVVGQPLAERGLRFVGGFQMHRSFQPGMERMAAPKCAARCQPPGWVLERHRHAGRRAFHHSPGPTTGPDRGGSERRVRRD